VHRRNVDKNKRDLTDADNALALNIDANDARTHDVLPFETNFGVISHLF